MAGEDLIAVSSICQININGRMSLIISLLFIVLETCEHGTVLHIMAIDDGMKVTEIRSVGCLPANAW